MELLLSLLVFPVIFSAGAGLAIQDTSEDLNQGISALDFTYHYFNPTKRNEDVVLKFGFVTPLRKSSFNASKETLFIVHGYYENATTPMPTTIKNSLINGSHDLNVFIVDWSYIWENNTPETFTSSLKIIGSYFANFLNQLVTDFKLQLAKSTLVGHSAGVPICGFAALATKGNVGVVVGLDPAITHSAKKGDAQFVQIVHTTTGSDLILGDADYYPTGGRNQTGCDNFGCSHGRAFLYYAESLNSNKFLSKQCTNYTDFKAEQCKSNPSSAMGMLQIDTKAKGKYFLDTNSQSPYAKGG